MMTMDWIISEWFAVSTVCFEYVSLTRQSCSPVFIAQVEVEISSVIVPQNADLCYQQFSECARPALAAMPGRAEWFGTPGP